LDAARNAAFSAILSLLNSVEHRVMHAIIPIKNYAGPYRAVVGLLNELKTGMPCSYFCPWKRPHQFFCFLCFLVFELWARTWQTDRRTDGSRHAIPI